MKRRSFLKGSLAFGLVSLAAIGGLLSPRRLLAAWPKTAFAAEDVKGALEKLYGNISISESKAIEIKVPEVAENGATVPVTINTTLPDVKHISIIVEKNPNPLIASFDLTPEAAGFISTRIKMAETSQIMVLVQSGDKFFSTTQTVKVVIGGCGA